VVEKTLKRCPSLGLRSLNLFLLTGSRQETRLIAVIPRVGSGKADRTNRSALSAFTPDRADYVVLSQRW